ncbi:MAG: FAD-dependent oxidoreductase [Cyanobacteria bacterium P01_A01_bin.37]
MEYLKSDVLVVGGGTGGTAAAIQAARRGAHVILVSEFSWLGGMLTSAGVSAPDGNELEAFQTGLWGAFLRELCHRQAGGMNHGWVSFFTYHPQTGADIFSDWVSALPNLQWISGQVPLEVNRIGDRLSSVRFADYQIEAHIILDGTELGDVLALADVAHRWGWELQSEFDEPSAPTTTNQLTETYPVQTPTWVVMMRDFGENANAPHIPSSSSVSTNAFEGFMEGYEPSHFLNYGRLPDDRFMINWPQKGNDYSHDLNRLIASPDKRHKCFQEALDHSHAFASEIQTVMGQRYGLATDMFPSNMSSLGGGAFALQPYIRESRRLVGVVTVREQDILPQVQGQVAALPIDKDGRSDAIAFGNYPNDHHYPTPESETLTLAPKSIQWGGRWTGTPFTIPYRSLIPKAVDGLMACDKNISVSHIANGATRLQPIVLGIGQAAGMAAALCAERQCQPRKLPVQVLQDALLTEAIAPAALVPLFNCPPSHPHWLRLQRHYLDDPGQYPATGHEVLPSSPSLAIRKGDRFVGHFRRHDIQHYRFEIHKPMSIAKPWVRLVTVNATIDTQLMHLPEQCLVTVWGILNQHAQWLLVNWIQL